MTSPVDGPFGRRSYAPGVPDLAAMAAEAAQREEMQAARAQGMRPLPEVMIELFSSFAQGLINEVAGIREALIPETEIEKHMPCVTQVNGPTGQFIGYMVYCVACSMRTGNYTYPCQVRTPEDMEDWPNSKILVLPPAPPTDDSVSLDELRGSEGSSSNGEAPRG